MWTCEVKVVGQVRRGDREGNQGSVNLDIRRAFYQVSDEGDDVQIRDETCF